MKLLWIFLDNLCIYNDGQPYSFMPNCREVKKKKQWANYQVFLKWGRVFLGHSLIIIKWTWGFFSPKFVIWPSYFVNTKKIVCRGKSQALSKSIFRGNLVTQMNNFNQFLCHENSIIIFQTIPVSDIHNSFYKYKPSISLKISFIPSKISLIESIYNGYL